VNETQNPDSPPASDPPLSTRERVERITAEHTAPLDGKTILNHRRRKRGCASCITAERVNEANEILRWLNPDDWPKMMQARTAQFMLAADDLRFSGVVAGGALLPPGIGGPGVYMGPPPAGAQALAQARAAAEDVLRARRERQ
jgi:hypothetical protein